jgi:hypothetical protein
MTFERRVLRQMCREVAQGNYAILRHLPAASRVLSPGSFEALAEFLEGQLEARDDEVVAQVVRREGWAEFASRYPETAQVLQLRLWEAVWPGLVLLTANIKGSITACLLRWKARLPLLALQVGQWLKRRLYRADR